MAPEEITVRLISTGKLVAFVFDDTTLTVKYLEPRSHLEIVHRQVLIANFDQGTRVLQISYLVNKKPKWHLSLVQDQGEVQEIDNEAALEWTNTLMHRIYEGSGIRRARRLKVLVNPHSGIRKGESIFIKTIEPIFRASNCTIDITFTEGNGHAYNIAKDLDLAYDAIVTVSGDGLIHEVLNGFAHHDNPREAFCIPIAPVPTGSGNGLALNLLGIKKGLDVVEAALNVVKGRPMDVDLFSLTQDGKRTISFMSQALGLMADLDVGTDHLRWMGDARFMVGLIRGVIQFKPCPVQLSIKVAENDKTKMVEASQASRKGDQAFSPALPLVTQGSSTGLPPLLYSNEDSDGWTTIDQPLLYVYAGKGPYVGRDLMAFPVSLPNDGLIDVIAMPTSSRTDFLSGLGGAAKGESFWNPKLQYFKAHAYRVKPLTTKGLLAVDGEIFPFQEFQVETHQGLGKFMSPHGYYAVEFSGHCPTSEGRAAQGQNGGPVPRGKAEY